MSHPEQLPICLNVTMNLDEKFGGLTSSLPRFCDALTKTGRFTGRLAAFCTDEETAPGSLPPSALSRFPAGRLRWLTDPQLRAQLGALIQGASIVHIHGLWQEHSLETAGLCRKFRVPYVVSAHGMLEPWALNHGRWKKRLYLACAERAMLKGAAGLRALTRSEVGDYRDIGLVNPIEVIPNGIDLPKHGSSALFLESFPKLAGKKLVLFLGRMHKKKGIDILCRAWAEIQEQFPEAHVVIAGPDEDQTLKSLFALTTALKLDGRVTFTGMIRGETKWAALASASLFVLPSHSEGFSVAILEALGSGLPVIVSKACHFPEIVDAHCGWQIEPETSQLVAALTEALTATPDVLLQMGANGRDLMSRDFSWTSVGERAADAFENWCVPSAKYPHSHVAS